MSPGGSPTNMSVGVRRLGLSTVLLTAVGDDPVGEFVISFLKKEEVETKYITTKKGNRTSCVFEIAGTNLTKQPSRSATIFAAERAKEKGTTVISDIDFRRDKW